jgi:signal transduction histidine kinase
MENEAPGSVAPGGAAASVLEKIPVVIALLDEQRKVVFGQDRLLAIVGHGTLADAAHHAPGDVLHCVNALAAPDGCGSSEACALCGANQAINRSKADGEPVTQECRIRYEGNDGVGDLDLTVTATPYESAGRSYTMLTVLDSSNEKRRRALERVFFHDIMNVAGGIAGLAGVLRQATSQDEFHEMLNVMERSSRVLLDEIEAQRQLASAETGDLDPDPGEVSSGELLREVIEAMSFHHVAELRNMRIADDCEELTAWTDRTLLRRVLVNLTKNALEATEPGGTILLRSQRSAGQVVFSVQNPGVIPRDVQLQLFQRSFSTRGRDRGIGTYSVRLLTERYLGGSVAFTSNSETGTIFTITLPAGA